MSQHSTTVTLKNPSATDSLKISRQGRVAPENTRHLDFVDDSRVGSISPNSIGALGGGQFNWKRRFVLIADRPTSVSITSRSSNFVVEQLKLIDYADAGLCWDVVRELAPAKVGATYELDAKTRISIRIDQKDETLDDAYVNLRQTGDATISIVQQEERAVYRQTRAVAWTPPSAGGEVAPGASADFLINDNARLVVETDSKRDVELVIANKNVLHALRLSHIDNEGGESAVANIGQQAGVSTGLWAPGLQYVTGRIVIRKGLGAIIVQSPL